MRRQLQQTLAALAVALVILAIFALADAIGREGERQAIEIERTVRQSFTITVERDPMPANWDQVNLVRLPLDPADGK